MFVEKINQHTDAFVNGLSINYSSFTTRCFSEVMRKGIIYILLLMASAVLFILPALLLPLDVQPIQSREINLSSLIILIVVNYAIVVYLIERLNLHGIKLFLATFMIVWGLQTFMTQIETWYFREAMPAISDEELLNLFIGPLLTYITFIPLGIWVLGKRKKSSTSTEICFLTDKLWRRTIMLSVIYVIIYFVFGYFIAWQYEEVRVFYSGSIEKHGFLRQIQETIQSNKLIIPFQLIRGFLWILPGWLLIAFLKVRPAGKVLMVALIYAALPTMQLIVNNPFMPQEVRITHFLKVGSSQLLFGD